MRTSENALLGTWVNSVGYLGDDAFLGQSRADRRDACCNSLQRW